MSAAKEWGKIGGEMTAAELIAYLRPLNPSRRFAVYARDGIEFAVAIDNPNGSWDMFAAAYLGGKWVECLIPSIQEKADWQEITECELTPD